MKPPRRRIILDKNTAQALAKASATLHRSPEDLVADCVHVHLPNLTNIANRAMALVRKEFPGIDKRIAEYKKQHGL